MLHCAAPSYHDSDDLHLDSDHVQAVQQLAADAVHVKAPSDGEHDQAPAKTRPLVGIAVVGLLQTLFLLAMDHVGQLLH